MSESDTTPEIRIQPITATLELPPAITERGIPVPESNWSLLESRIRNIEEIDIERFNIGTGVSAGIAITAFASAETLTSSHQNFWLFMIVGIAAIVCTVLCYAFASRLNKCNSFKKEYVLEDLRTLKRKYIIDQNET